MEVKFTIDNYPAGPYLPDEFKPWQPLNETMQCTKCGLSFKGPIGYVCTDINCPVGLGPVISYQTTNL